MQRNGCQAASPVLAIGVAVSYAGGSALLVAVVTTLIAASSLGASAIRAFPEWSRVALPEVERWIQLFTRRRRTRS